MLNDLCRPLYNQFDIFPGDVICWCQHDHIAIDSIGYATAWEQGDAKLVSQTSSVDRGGELFGSWEWGFGRLVLDEFDLESMLVLRISQRHEKRGKGPLTPHMNPLPLTFPTFLCPPSLCFKSSPRYSPSSLTFSNKSSSWMTSWTAHAAAHATGWPWYVWLWTKLPVPLVKTSTTSRCTSKAPMGWYPAPRPLATVWRCGTTESCCQAWRFPVRPMPDMTSSRMKRAPWRSQMDFIVAR